MNVFQVNYGQAVTKDLLRMIGLGMFLANEFDVRNDMIFMETEFSMSNINSIHYNQRVYSSPHQTVVENFDKPIVEIGDIVVCAVPQSKFAQTKEFYDDYAKIDSFFAPIPASVEGEPDDLVHLVVGVTNSSQTDFFEPFADLDRVSFHADKIQKIVLDYGLDASEEWAEFNGLVDRRIQEVLNTSK